MSKYGRPQKYYALADITLLRFDVRAFAHTYVYMLRALRVPRSERYVELFCSTPRVPWRQQPARKIEWLLRALQIATYKTVFFMSLYIIGS